MRRNDDAAVERMVRMNMLLDVYGSLLTDKQRRFMNMHYEQDQSFGEIAREYGVSRQAIHDSVRHGEASLEEFERNLHLVERGGRAELRRETAERLLDLKQRIQQHGIIYNADWITRELDEIVENVAGRGEAVGENLENPDEGPENATPESV